MSLRSRRRIFVRQRRRSSAVAALRVGGLLALSFAAAFGVAVVAVAWPGGSQVPQNGQVEPAGNRKLMQNLPTLRLAAASARAPFHARQDTGR